LNSRCGDGTKVLEVGCSQVKPGHNCTAFAPLAAPAEQDAAEIVQVKPAPQTKIVFFSVLPA